MCNMKLISYHLTLQISLLLPSILSFFTNSRALLFWFPLSSCPQLKQAAVFSKKALI